MALPRRRMTDGRMPNAGRRATNVAPRFNNGPAAGRRRPNRRIQRGGVPNKVGKYPMFPKPQEAPPDFLPMTPGWEAGMRGLEDQYMQSQQELINQRDLIQPQVNQATARLDTDKGFDTDRLKENLAERGVYTPFGPGGEISNRPTGSGVGDTLYNRNVEIPYGRQYADIGTWASQQFSDIASQLSGLDTDRTNAIAELLLNRAADSAEQMPMNVPQYSTGGRVLRGQRYNNKPDNKPRDRNRNRRRNGRR